MGIWLNELEDAVRREARAEDVLARMLIGFADIDQDRCTAVQFSLQVGRR